MNLTSLRPTACICRLTDTSPTCTCDYSPSGACRTRIALANVGRTSQRLRVTLCRDDDASGCLTLDDGGENAGPLAPGAVQVVYVHCAVTVATPLAARLVVTGEHGVATVSITATVAAQRVTAPATCDLGDVPLLTPVARNVTVSNVAYIPVAVNVRILSATGGVTVSPDHVVLPPRSDRHVTVAYCPTTLTTLRCELVLLPVAGVLKSSSITLTAKCAPTGAPVAPPTTLTPSRSPKRSHKDVGLELLDEALAAYTMRAEKRLHATLAAAAATGSRTTLAPVSSSSSLGAEVQARATGGVRLPSSPTLLHSVAGATDVLTQRAGRMKRVDLTLALAAKRSRDSETVAQQPVNVVRDGSAPVADLISAEVASSWIYPTLAQRGGVTVALDVTALEGILTTLRGTPDELRTCATGTALDDILNATGAGALRVDSHDATVSGAVNVLPSRTSPHVDGSATGGIPPRTLREMVFKSTVSATLAAARDREFKSSPFAGVGRMTVAEMDEVLRLRTTLRALEATVSQRLHRSRRVTVAQSSNGSTLTLPPFPPVALLHLPTGVPTPLHVVGAPRYDATGGATLAAATGVLSRFKSTVSTFTLRSRIDARLTTLRDLLRNVVGIDVTVALPPHVGSAATVSSATLAARPSSRGSVNVGGAEGSVAGRSLSSATGADALSIARRSLSDAVSKGRVNVGRKRSTPATGAASSWCVSPPVATTLSGEDGLPHVDADVALPPVALADGETVADLVSTWFPPRRFRRFLHVAAADATVSLPLPTRSDAPVAQGRRKTVSTWCVSGETVALHVALPVHFNEVAHFNVVQPPPVAELTPLTVPLLPLLHAEMHVSQALRAGRVAVTAATGGLPPFHPPVNVHLSQLRTTVNVGATGPPHVALATVSPSTLRGWAPVGMPSPHVAQRLTVTVAATGERLLLPSTLTDVVIAVPHPVAQALVPSTARPAAHAGRAAQRAAAATVSQRPASRGSTTLTSVLPRPVAAPVAGQSTLAATVSCVADVFDARPVQVGLGLDATGAATSCGAATGAPSLRCTLTHHVDDDFIPSTSRPFLDVAGRVLRETVAPVSTPLTDPTSTDVIPYASRFFTFDDSTSTVSDRWCPTWTAPTVRLELLDGIEVQSDDSESEPEGEDGTDLKGMSLAAAVDAFRPWRRRTVQVEAGHGSSRMQQALVRVASSQARRAANVSDAIPARIVGVEALADHARRRSRMQAVRFKSSSAVPEVTSSAAAGDSLSGDVLPSFAAVLQPPAAVQQLLRMTPA